MKWRGTKKLEKKWREIKKGRGRGTAKRKEQKGKREVRIKRRGSKKLERRGTEKKKRKGKGKRELKEQELRKQ